MRYNVFEFLLSWKTSFAQSKALYNPLPRFIKSIINTQTENPMKIGCLGIRKEEI